MQCTILLLARNLDARGVLRQIQAVHDDVWCERVGAWLEDLRDVLLAQSNAIGLQLVVVNWEID